MRTIAGYQYKNVGGATTGSLSCSNWHTMVGIAIQIVAIRIHNVALGVASGNKVLRLVYKMLQPVYKVLQLVLQLPSKVLKLVYYMLQVAYKVLQLMHKVLKFTYEGVLLQRWGIRYKMGGNVQEQQ
ncbi:hypothetical protein HaLaN_26714 [Haematococcus lacustris]|uniref:Uncharacterized protein n=1 Tax=Haematococcus lacustris TaxID=44745 RepID=A0A6A0A6S5_HAELA|nr:hypothetical protein HaLaN_26714 [Haematococcus lacustris]